MIVLVFIVAFLAFLLSAIAGGGAGLALIPLLRIVLPGSEIPAALSLGTTTNSISRIFTFKSDIRWDITFRLLPAALPMVWLGAWLLSFLNPVYIELLLSFFLLSNLKMLFKKKSDKEVTPKLIPKNYLFLVGALAGFLSGFTGAVGLLFNKFYFQLGLTKEEIIATRASNEVLLHVFKLVLYSSFGLLTTMALKYGLVISVAAILASISTKFFLKLINEFWFKKIGNWTMVTAGAFMLFSSSSQIADSNNVALNFNIASNSAETKLQWKQSSLALEFEYDDGFEYEHPVQFSELPASKQVEAKKLTSNNKVIRYEEVHGYNVHYYEVYMLKDNKVVKIDF
ncbi:MAG: sulfite exporter TauE/SafE family protein [Flexibacteraceae bacterium]